MADAFPRLQDPHNRRLRLVVPIGSNALMRFFVLGCGFFELHGVNLDAVFRVAESGVQSECVSGIYVSAFGMFGQRPEFGAGEGLESTV